MRNPPEISCCWLSPPLHYRWSEGRSGGLWAWLTISIYWSPNGKNKLMQERNPKHSIIKIRWHRREHNTSVFLSEEWSCCLPGKCSARIPQTHCVCFLIRNVEGFNSFISIPDTNTDDYMIKTNIFFKQSTWCKIYIHAIRCWHTLPALLVVWHTVGVVSQKWHYQSLMVQKIPSINFVEKDWI